MWRVYENSFMVLAACNMLALGIYRVDFIPDYLAASITI
jgi:hypothetical protein